MEEPAPHRMKVTSECPEHLHSVQWVCLLLAKTGWKVGASVRETLGLYCGHPGETGGSEGTSIARPGTSLRALPASSLPRPLGRTRRSTPRPPHEILAFAVHYWRSMAPANSPQPTCGRVGLFAVWCSPTHRNSAPFGERERFLAIPNNSNTHPSFGAWSPVHARARRADRVAR